MLSPTGVLEIDLAAVADNYRRLCAEAPGCRLAPAVKADAYGLGAAEVAPALWATGARRFFVAHLGEALTLRPLLPEAELCVLNGVQAGEERDFVAGGLLPVLNSLGQIALWQGAARAAGRPLPALLHLDSGMSRLGLPDDEVARLAAAPERLEGIALQLVMSHLACAEDLAGPMNEQQRRHFLALAERLPPAARQAPRSLANSSGLFLGPAFRFDWGRPGYALYGGNPTPGQANPMRPAVALKLRVLQLRRVDSPMTVGYGASHRVGGPTRLATLAGGYADGIFRALSNRARVFWKGQALPIVGRVSMDLTVVDVTALPPDAVVAGDYLELLGPAQGVDELAAAAGTIGYELLTQLGRRYRRSYAPARSAAGTGA